MGSRDILYYTRLTIPIFIEDMDKQLHSHEVMLYDYISMH